MASSRSKSIEPYSKRLAQMPNTARKKVELADYSSEKPNNNNNNRSNSKISIRVIKDDVKVKENV